MQDGSRVQLRKDHQWHPLTVLKAMMTGGILPVKEEVYMVSDLFSDLCHGCGKHHDYIKLYELGDGTAYRADDFVEVEPPMNVSALFEEAVLV